MGNSLITIRDYGYIEIRLKDLMEKRNISRNALARSINARFEVVDKWYSGHVEIIDADILARICYVLECTPQDIIIYTNNRTQTG